MLAHSSHPVPFSDSRTRPLETKSNGTVFWIRRMRKTTDESGKVQKDKNEKNEEGEEAWGAKPKLYYFVQQEKLWVMHVMSNEILLGVSETPYLSLHIICIIMYVFENCVRCGSGAQHSPTCTAPGHTFSQQYDRRETNSWTEVVYDLKLKQSMH